MRNLGFSDWSFGGDLEREEEVTSFLQELFTDFWFDHQLEEQSDRKQERYLRNLNLLGEALVDRAVADPQGPETEMTPYELFLANVNENEGPLIDPDDEIRQDEFDAVCGKVYRYLMETQWEHMPDSR